MKFSGMKFNPIAAKSMAGRTNNMNTGSKGTTRMLAMRKQEGKEWKQYVPNFVYNYMVENQLDKKIKALLDEEEKDKRG